MHRRSEESGQLRIIGGRFRGRKLPVPAQPGLRPTSDRVRETLFNWLQPVIAGSRCLDLFAGSGALGFEAVSRGAEVVVMIERSQAVIQTLQTGACTLGAPGVRVQRADALRWLSGPAELFDIVFLDPPFDQDLLGSTCALLSANGWLAARGLIYLEAPASQQLPVLPSDWTLVRDKRAGRVRFALAAAHGEGAAIF